MAKYASASLLVWLLRSGLYSWFGPTIQGNEEEIDWQLPTTAFLLVDSWRVEYVNRNEHDIFLNWNNTDLLCHVTQHAPPCCLGNFVEK